MEARTPGIGCGGIVPRIDGPTKERIWGPQSCTVAPDDAELLAPGANAGTLPRRTVAQGERVVALDALPTEDQLLPIKVQTVVGIMRRRDLVCELEKTR